MSLSGNILLGAVIVAAVLALGISGYLIYRKLSATNPQASEGFSSKENFEVKVDKNVCHLFDINTKQPEGWLCFTTPDSKMKKCCSQEESSNFADINGKKVPLGENGKYHENLDINADISELKLFNKTSHSMKINYLSRRDNKNDTPKYLATLPANSFVYIYLDNEGFSFEPDYVFYASINPSDSSMKFKPYVLGEEDYEIEFEPIISLSNYTEIPTLYIVNKSSQSQDIYHKNKYLGRVSDFSYEKMEHEYTLFTDNNHNGFALNSNIETRKLIKDFNGKMKQQRPEFIPLKDKNMISSEGTATFGSVLFV